MSEITGFLLHPSSPLHDTGWGHPEHQGRLRALASSVGNDLLTLHGHVEQMEAGDGTEHDLLLVHTEEHVRQVRTACQRAEDENSIIAIDSDTKVSSESWNAALGSVGTAITATRAVARGEIRNAFVATRPPGHHATPDQAMGFCLFNNIAVTARWLQAEGYADRILIIDWDVHHGNGTHEVFYTDPTVYFLSLHQSPHYPGTGSVNERGSDDGEGYTLNVPLPSATSRVDYLEAFDRALEKTLKDFSPEFVLVSAGFDVMAQDPLGGMLLAPPDLYVMPSRIVEGTAAACNGKVVALLECGYNPPRVGQGVVAVIRGLAGLEQP